jgi:Flp pilus assembly protein TadD
MKDIDLSPYEEDFGLMVEAGFIATKNSDEESARRLFNAAAVLKPQSPAPLVGLGYIALNKLKLKEAEMRFKAALEMEPEHHLAKAFLGIVYLLVEPKRSEGEKLLQDAMEKSDDPSIVSLVKSSMEWAKSDLKKGNTPFFGE